MAKRVAKSRNKKTKTKRKSVRKITAKLALRLPDSFIVAAAKIRRLIRRQQIQLNKYF